MTKDEIRAKYKAKAKAATMPGYVPSRAGRPKSKPPDPTANAKVKSKVSAFVPKPSRAPNRSTEEKESKFLAETRKETALADLRELELAQKRGELAPVVLLNAFMGGCIVKARDRLMRLPGELRDRLAANSDPIQCERMVEKEIRAALAELKSMEIETIPGVGEG
jgi:hypothetical protein